jgi:tetratricopeptide (TPR) repeat protein
MYSKKSAILTLAVLALLSFFVIRPSADVAMPSGPVSLTNPDGQSMILERYNLRVAVNGPLQLTEMEMIFRNPENRVMEGRFLYMLPPGATISRFAKDVNGKLMEGEVVEKLRAQSIYTEILHTMRDPALLETDQGNRFSARVFPIPANGVVTLLLGYSQQLPAKDGERKVRVPLAGMPKIGEFKANVVINELPGEKLIASEFFGRIEPQSGNPYRLGGDFGRDYLPQKDLDLTFKTAETAPAVRATKAGNFQMLTFRAQFDNILKKIDNSSDWVFYFDTSASNADNEARNLAAINEVLNGMVPTLREKDNLFSAYAFDVTTKEILPPTSMNSKDGGPLMPKVVTALRARHALGATNLAATLKQIGEQARAAKKPTRFVLVSDGIATLGARESRDVVAALGDWPETATLHALVIGNKQDEKMLNAIVDKTQGRVITLPFTENLPQQVAKAIADLEMPLGVSFEFYDEGAAWIYPKTFRDIRPGNEVVVFSELKNGAPSKPGVAWKESKFHGLKAHGEDLKATPADVPDFAPLLQREAYRAYLDHLEKLEQTETDAGKRAEIHKQRIETSVKNRVLCPLTSLLVLETENDYRRFGIERTSLADVMIVGANGIELRKRAPDEVPAPRVAANRGEGKGEAQKRKKSDDADKSAPAKEAAEKAAAAPKPEAKAAAGEEAVEALDALKDAAPADGAARQRFGGARQPARDEAGAEQLRRLEETSADDRIGGGGGQSGGRGAHPFAANGAPAATAAPAPEHDAPGTPPPAPAVRDPEARRSNNDARADAPAERRALAAVAAPLQQAQSGKAAAPEWSKQLGFVPPEDQMNALRAAVQASPRDRNLRNGYADALFKAKQWDSLQGQVFEWLPFDPENPQVFEYLGKSAAGLNDPELALRAYTSIAEVAPNRAALLSRSGWLLLSTKKYEMAEEMFREALKNRQDDCNIYRGLALSFWLRKDYEKAVGTLEDALKKSFNPRYGDVKRVMSEELGYIFRAWMNSGGNAESLTERAKHANVDLKRNDTFRATLCWETDASDVDLHVVDPNGEECFYSHKNNASGLELYSDQTQGLGPEVVRCEKAITGTYHVGVNYFSAGAMGVSRGIVVIMQPKDGIVENMEIVPFCLVPGGPDMRHLGAAKY